MKIAYIMSRFPLLSETFILREMDAFETQGGTLSLYPLICQEQPVVHHEARKWMPRRVCLPYLSPEILGAFFRTLIQSPLKMIWLLAQILYFNIPSPKFLLRAIALFPKSVCMARRMQTEGIQHIHVHYATHPALAAYVISTLTGIPYSITIHSHDIYDNRAMLKPKLQSAAFLVTISDYNVQYLKNLYGKQIGEKLIVIHCGIDPHAFRPANHSKHPEQPFQILQIGSLHWKKSQVDLLEAIAILRERLPNIKLEIIGEGPERSAIEACIRDLGLGTTVQLSGALTHQEVQARLPFADCYVQSSISEGIPVSIMEALACQLPVVATRITGIPELVLDGQTGLLVPPRDPRALANAIQHIHDHPEEARQMGIAGRQHVLREFVLEDNVARLVDRIRTSTN